MNTQFRKDAIEAMCEYHEAHKHAKDIDNREVEHAIDRLAASDRNFMLVTAKMPDIGDIYPVSGTISDKYTLADLVTAYRMYLKDSNS